MPRIAVLIGGAVVLLLAVAQFLIPRLAERKVEDRLEEDGGSANVSISSFPAARLLFEDGDSFKVEGDGLRIDPEEDTDALERLDGFGDVSIKLDDLAAGPLSVKSFLLERDGDGPEYEVAMDATTTPREVAAFLGSRAGGAFGEVLGDFAGGTLPDGGETEIALQIDAVVESRNREVVVRDVTGTIAGIPSGVLAKLVVDAVVSRL